MLDRRGNERGKMVKVQITLDIKGLGAEKWYQPRAPNPLSRALIVSRTIFILSMYNKFHSSKATWPF